MSQERGLRLLIGAATVAVVSCTLGALAYLHMPLPPDGDPVLGSPMVVMFENEGCTWCEGFRKKAARAYMSSEYGSKAPLKFLSVDDGPPPKRYRFSGPRVAPLLVLFDQYGRELDRIGYEPATSEPIESMVRRGLRRAKG